MRVWTDDAAASGVSQSESGGVTSDCCDDELVSAIGCEAVSHRDD